MDLVWFRRYRKGGGTDGFVDWEFSAGTKSYEDAPAPAQVGKRVVEGVFDTELAPESAALMNNAVHWATGMGWGALYSVVAGSTRSSHPGFGAVLGPTAWAARCSTCTGWRSSNGCAACSRSNPASTIRWPCS